MIHGRNAGTAPDPIRDALASVVERFRDDMSGDVATYIPELATVDPDGFGAALVSVHGRVHSASDADRAFTIQSVSKPFVYTLAVSELGLDDVARHVGFEPSGEPFNATGLEPDANRPDNPLFNAGAIVTSALIDGSTVRERVERVRSFLSACAGRELDVDEDVFASETATGDRNRALAHLARSSGVLRQSVDDATEVYFRQCSIFSPRLDPHGNSVRGAAVLRSLSNDFDLHVFDRPDAPRSPVVSWTIRDDSATGVLRAASSI